jgi:hypothetical protein
MRAVATFFAFALSASVCEYGAVQVLGPNLALNPDASPAALTRRALGAG